MTRTIASLFSVALATSLLGAPACSGGEITVGKSEQELKKKTDGGVTGNGQTCSWEGTVSSSGPVSSGDPGGYAVGDTFKSPDGCNDCTCTAQGIMCTMRACGGGSSPGNPGGGEVACSAEAKACPDGSYVGRTGPNCEFAPCPGGDDVGCPTDAKICPDGSAVGRTGPNCAFAPCPGE